MNDLDRENTKLKVMSDSASSLTNYFLLVASLCSIAEVSVFIGLISFQDDCMKSTAAIGVLFFVCMLLLAIAIGIGAWVSVSEKGYRLTGEIFDRPNERPASKQEIEKLAADCLARIKKSIKIALAMVTATFFISAIAVAVRFAPILLAAFAG